MCPKWIGRNYVYPNMCFYDTCTEHLITGTLIILVVFGAFFLWHKIPIYPYMLAYVGVINCRNCNCRVRVRVCRNCNCLVLYCCVLLRFVAICCVLLRFVVFCFGLTPVHINMCLNVEEIILIHSSTKTTTVSSNAYGQPPPSTFCSMTEQE